MRKFLFAFFIALLAQTSAQAFDSSPKVSKDPEFQKAKSQIEKKDWPAAVATLEPFTAANPKDADGFNLLGYSYRHLKRYDDALKAYNKALTLDPKHRGAHEYIGEAYIEMGQLDKAQEHLNALDKLCFFPCEEYSELKEELEEARKKPH